MILVVSQRVEAFLHRDVQRNVFRPQILIHPLHAGFADRSGLGIGGVVTKAQQRALGIQRNHDERAKKLREREGIEGVVPSKRPWRRVCWPMVDAQRSRR